VIHSWEIAAIAALVLAVVLQRRRGDMTTAWPEGCRWDWALAGSCVALGGFPLFLLWREIATQLAPSGADFEGYYLSAIALESGDFSLYVKDRYPGFPWLTSLFAGSTRTIHEAGARINMWALAISGAGLFWIGRHLGGRTAGVVGALIALRVSLVSDLGHTFTHYPLAAALDVALLAGVLGLIHSPGVVLAWVVGLAGAAAGACDPKQFATVGLAFAVAAVVIVRSSASNRQKGFALAGLGAPLVLLNIAVGQMPVVLFTLEEVATRVQLHFQVDPGLVEGAAEGFRLGAPGALFQLPASLWNVATGVAPEVHQPGLLAPLALEGMPVVWGPVSPLWVLGIPALAGCLLWRRKTGWGAQLAVICIPLFIAWPNFHMHYQNRYFLAPALLAPVLVAAAVQVLAGSRAVAWVGLVALGWPTSPFSKVDTSYLERTEHRHDIWVGREHGVDLEVLRWATEALPEDTVIYDFSERRPAPTLAAAHPYVRCNMEGDQCVSKMAAHTGTRAAVLWAGEFLSSRVPGGTGEILARKEQGGGIPEAVGDCWQQVRWLNPDAGVFRWTCDAPPRPLPHQPPPPPPEDW